MFIPNLHLEQSYLIQLLTEIKNDTHLYDAMRSPTVRGAADSFTYDKLYKPFIDYTYATAKLSDEYKEYNRIIYKTIIVFFQEEQFFGKLDSIMENPARDQDAISDLTFAFYSNIEDFEIEKLNKDKGVILNGEAILARTKDALQVISLDDIKKAEIEIGSEIDSYQVDTWNPIIGTSILDIKQSFIEKSTTKLNVNLLKNGLAIQSIEQYSDSLVKVIATNQDLSNEIEVYINKAGQLEYFIDLASGIQIDLEQKMLNDSLNLLTTHLVNLAGNIARRAEDKSGQKISNNLTSSYLIRDAILQPHPANPRGHQLNNSEKTYSMSKGRSDNKVTLNKIRNKELHELTTEQNLQTNNVLKGQSEDAIKRRLITGARMHRKAKELSRKEKMQKMADKRKIQNNIKKPKQKKVRTTAENALRGALLASIAFSFSIGIASFMI